MILNGTGEQRIFFASVNSYINELDLQNDKVIITTPVRITKLISDGKMTSEGGTLYNINLNGHTLEVEGDVTLAGGCNLASGTLKVNGNVMHTSGTVTVKGSLIVDGNYTLATTRINEEDEEVLASSSGSLVMAVNASLLEISGNFINYSSSTNTFSKGLMKVGGNIEDLYGGSNFVCSGTHTVRLNGKNPQSVSLKGSRNIINILQLTEEVENYTFVPNPCWKTLEMYKVPVEAVEIKPQTVVLSTGDTANLDFNIFPIDAEYSSVVWGSEDETIAVVENGNVKAVSEGSTRIYAEIDGVRGYSQIIVKEETVHQVDGIKDMQSSHPYAAYSLDSWEYKVKDALSLIITFSSDTYVTVGDSIDIYCGDTLQQSYTGGELTGKTVTIPGNQFKIFLRSGEQSDAYGFKVEKIECIKDTSLKSIYMKDKYLTLKVGDKEKMTVMYLPIDTTETGLTWTSSDEKVATVSGNGIVEANGTGTAVITATSTLYPEISAESVIRVASYQYKVNFNDETDMENIEESKLIYGENISIQQMPEVQEKEGYAFIGWYTQPEGKGDEITESTIITEDMTVYAYWKPLEEEQKTGIWIENISSQVYTGKAIKPIVKVYYGNKLLTEKKDYNVKYLNNVKAADRNQG